MEIRINQHNGTWGLFDKQYEQECYYTNSNNLTDRQYLFVSGDNSIIPTIKLIY